MKFNERAKVTRVLLDLIALWFLQSGTGLTQPPLRKMVNPNKKKHGTLTSARPALMQPQGEVLYLKKENCYHPCPQ